MTEFDAALADGTDVLPLIGYKNIFRRSDATVTYSTQSTGFEASNAYDWTPSTSWLPSASGASTLSCSFPEAVGADYLGVYGANLHQNGGSIKVEYSQDGGGTWTEVANHIAGSTTRDLIFATWSKVYAQDWRVTVTSTPASNIPVLAVGELLRMWGGNKEGATPPRFARNVELRTNRSVEGTFLGRRVRRYGTTPQLLTVDIPDTWVDQYWLPFMIHAEKKPFFYAPNHGPHVGSRGAALCWVAGSIPAPKYSTQGFCTISLPLVGQAGQQQEELDDA